MIILLMRMRQHFDNDQLTSYLQEAYEARPEKSSTVSKPFYDTWRKQQDRKGVPTSQTFLWRWGSWNEALRANNLPTNQRPSGVKTQYELAELLGYMRRCELVAGHLSAPLYSSLARHYNWPSLATIRIRFGSWNKALEALEASNE